MGGATVGSAPDDGPQPPEEVRVVEPEQLELDAPPPEEVAPPEEVYATPAVLNL